MRRYSPCPVDGCDYRGDRANRHYRAHALASHVRCSCGWVGVSFARHAAQRRRRGYPQSHRPVARLSASIEALDEIGVWR